ncbi:granzyme A-like isoform X1 [Aquarana catesbeiana]|uniref:granzyme A-like isoform X1 n=1 Tax=Aquarana catesbeiana TaxID=8400 RepID=UPI003CC99B42
MKPFLSLQLSAIMIILLLDGRACMKIIKGKEAKPHSRPYMVHIKQEYWICGGILIKPHWVLTAAHCNFNHTANITLGAHSISAVEKEKQFLKTDRVITHELYKDGSFNYDVALLQLSKDANLTHAVKALPLPESCDEPVEGTVCEVAGWGFTRNTNNKPSDKLMEANVTIMKKIACKEYWEGKITENFICTKNQNGTETCKGDSGGPLICNGMLRGVVSFGERVCGINESPTVFTDLNSKIVCWIYKQLSGLP